MPLFIIVGLIVIVLVCVSIYIVRNKNEAGTKKSVANIVVFGLSLLALIFSFRSFMSITSYISDYGGSATLIYGETGALFPLLELAVLFALCIISGLRLISRAK